MQLNIYKISNSSYVESYPQEKNHSNAGPLKYSLQFT